MHASRATEDAHVDIFQTNVAVDDSGSDDLFTLVPSIQFPLRAQVLEEETYSRNRNTIRDLLQHRPSRSQRRRSHAVTDIVVNDDGSNDVQNDLEALQQAQRLGEVLRLFHLGNQTEESDVGAVGEDDVGDGREGVVEVRFVGDGDVLAAFVLHADTDHGDHNGGEDTQEGW